MKQYKTMTVLRRDIIPYEKNPRKIEQKNLKALENSLEEFGLVDPLVWNKRTGHLVSGHQRLKILDKNNTEKIECIIVDLDETKEKALNVAMNSKTLTGDWEQEILEELLDEIEAENELLFDELLLKELRDPEFTIEEEEYEGETDEDEIPEEVEPICKLGDIWQLGNHRLMCADSTVKENVEKLMDGKKADMVFTDPPYGISVQNTKGKILNDDTLDVFKKFQPIIKCVLNKKSHVYIFFGSKVACESLLILNNNFKQFNILTFPITNQTQPYPEGYFSSNYEMCYFTQHDGIKKHNTGVSEVSETTKKDKRYDGDGYLKKYYALSDLPITEHNINSIHPTQKKVESIIFYVEISSKENEIVLDLFGGSGSTLIAAQKTNRICYMMELDEHYCDVIIKRFEDFTGEKAKKIN